MTKCVMFYKSIFKQIELVVYTLVNGVPTDIKHFLAEHISPYVRYCHEKMIRLL